MNKLILLCVVICAITCTNIAFSQEKIKKNNQISQNNQAYSHSVITEKEQYNSLFEELEGTFQFQITKEDYKPLLSYDLLSQINAARTAETDVYIPVDPFIKIFVPSKKVINSLDFKKLDIILYNLNN